MFLYILCGVLRSNQRQWRTRKVGTTDDRVVPNSIIERCTSLEECEDILAKYSE